MWDLIRALMYALTAIQALILSYVYYVGYQKVKPTPIIRTLVLFFLSLGIFFSFTTILAFATIEPSIYYEPLRNLGAFFVLPVLLCLQAFRETSMDEKNNNHGNGKEREKK